MADNIEDYPVLIAQTGPLSGHRWSIADTLLLGREENCDIVIPSRQVSRSHARIRLTGEGVLLEDLGSKNGTHRNGLMISDPVILQDGDVIQIALAQQFVYLSSDATMPLEPIPEEGAMSQTHKYLLHLDKRSRRVWIGDKEVLPPLSVSQYGLLELLYERQGRVVERSELIANVWEEEDAVGVSEQALDALVRRLRDRLASVDSAHNYIVTVRGHGLRLDNPEAGS
ncbi:MAG: FHA domain-containing protein [Omnitrophica WOR_2 bacterium]